MSRWLVPRGLTAAALVAGCLTLAALVGPSVASATTDRNEYAAQADPICKSSNEGLTRLWKRFLSANAHGRFHAAGNALAAIGTNFYRSDNQLRAISPPPGDEARIAQWLGIYDQIAHNYKLSASAYRLGKYKRLSRLFGQSDRLQRSADNLVSDFPFQVCG